MILMRTLHIHAQWLDKGYFLIWSEPYMNPSELIGQLFAYHRPSYYGTFVRTERLGIREMIVLPADWAVDYWLEPPVTEHASLIWSEEAEGYRRLARHIQDSMGEGSVVPDYTQWRKGTSGWRIAWNIRSSGEEGLILGEDVAISIEERMFADKWLSHAIRGILSNNEHPSDDINQKLPMVDRYLSAHMKQLEMERSEWLDEAEWLLALGWEEAPAPFRLALQLSEPVDDGTWRLTIRVQDRDERSPHHLWCSVKGDILQGECPESWLPWLAERLTRECRRIIGIIGSLASSNDHEQLTDRLDDEQAWKFLMEWSPRLIEHGVSVLLPSWWERARRAKPKLSAHLRPMVEKTAAGMLGLRQLLQFDWQVSIGDMELSREEYEQIAANHQKLVSIQGRWVVVDQVLLASIQKKLRKYEREGGMPLRDVLEYGLLQDMDQTMGSEAATPSDVSTWIDLEYGQDVEQLLLLLRRIQKPPLIQIPRLLHGRLRDYQLEGVSWLAMLRRIGVGGCLADDMGLGKTVQWICYLLHVLETESPRQPSLLICPTSVLGNWQKEFERFAPSLNVHLHHGPNRLRGEAFKQAVKGADVVLTSYSLASLDEDDLRQFHWDSLCLDQAQNIKNYYTKQAQAIQHLPASHRVAMTGTPIENRLSELWSIMNFVNPGYLGNLRSFERQVRSIEKEQDDRSYVRIQALVRPFLLRREKKDPSISLNLPDKEELKCYVSLTAEQSVLYEQQLDRLFRRIDTMVTMERRGAVLSTIMRLKQLCDHPAMLHGQTQLPIDQLLEQSNKLMRLTEMVDEVREAGERCIIFTQFIEMGRLLQSVLHQRLGEQVMFMHGSIPKSTRDQMIEDFQRGTQAEPCGVFILSLKTGGTGLNLTAANHVFHYDRWWNPAVENQASDRVYRIGQQREVFVHKFISIGTLEEKIDDMLEQKMGLSRKIVGSGDQWIGELSNEELRDVLELRSV